MSRYYDDTEPYKSVAACMARFTFTRPVAADDLAVVRSELLLAAPGCAVEVISPWQHVVRVTVRDAAGLPVFGREYVAV